jgi:hypothetical protein
MTANRTFTRLIARQAAYLSARDRNGSDASMR